MLRPTRLIWSGELPGQLWDDFQREILSRFASAYAINIQLQLQLEPHAELRPEEREALQAALRQLGLPDTIQER